jgi:hypothetical protein
MNETVLAHWYSLFDTFAYSTDAFYDDVYQKLVRRRIPDVVLRRNKYSEMGPLSMTREYFEVKRGKLTFVLCAAPFGIDYFVSWWLLETPGCLSGCLTLLIPPLAIFTRHTTFYQEDSATVFRDVVHKVILESVDEMHKATQRVFEGDRNPVTKRRLL